MQRKQNDILFGKYQIISVIGTGSFGTVYLSKHIILECYRAIKIIPKANNSMTDSLLKEAKLLKSLHHPGIPSLYDIEEDAIAYYLIEEFVEGESLDSFLLHQTQISQMTFIDFGLQLCNIFLYLHTLHPSPILYLDLKPEHIIVCGMQIKLIDFNVATFLSNLGNLNYLYGNEQFSAPEIALGNPTLQSDIFSIGKVLQFLLPYVDVSVSPNLHKLIKKATAAECKDRLETVDDFLSALEKEKILLEQPPSRKKIAVLGSHSGCGATHITFSLVSCLNYMGYNAIYYEKGPENGLQKMIPFLSFVKEKNGMICYRYFKGYPSYGPGVFVPTDTAADFSVYDYGTQMPSDLLEFDYVILIGSNGIWRWQDAFRKWEHLKNLSNQKIILCNQGQKYTMHCFAKQCEQEVYHYPYEKNPFIITSEKVSFFSKTLRIKRRRFLFFHLKNRFIKRK